MVVGWIAAQLLFGYPDDHLYYAVMIVSSFAVLMMTILGRFAIHWAVLLTALALVPPIAPIVMSHVCAHLMLRCGAGRDEDDPWASVCTIMARRWLRAGNLASAMCVVLLYYWWDTLDRKRLPSFGDVVLTDPFRMMTDAFAPLVTGVFLAFALWYGVQFVRTGRIAMALRANPPHANEEPAAGETVY